MNKAISNESKQGLSIEKGHIMSDDECECLVASFNRGGNSDMDDFCPLCHGDEPDCPECHGGPHRRDAGDMADEAYEREIQRRMDDEF